MEWEDNDENRNARKTKENSVRDGKFQRFTSPDVFARRVGDNDDDPDSSSTRNEGKVVGREVVPRGRRSTDCNVARNYVSAVSTADIPPASFSELRALFSPYPLTCILPRPQPQEFGVSMKGLQEPAAFLFRSSSILSITFSSSYSQRTIFIFTQGTFYLTAVPPFYVFFSRLTDCIIVI